MPDIIDASRPQGIHYDFCDQPIWRIPRGTQDDLLYVKGLDGTDLVYYIDVAGPNAPFESYYFDIATCTEYPLPDFPPRGGVVLGVGSGRAVIDSRDYRAGTATEWVLELDTWAMRLIHQDQPGSYRTNATYHDNVFAMFASQEPNTRPATLTIYDLATGQASDVWTGNLRYSYMAVTDSFVLFEPEDLSCRSAAITHYVDLSDMSQGDIDDTCEKAQHGYMGSGRRIGYIEAQGMLPAPYTCVVLDMDSHQKWVLTQDDQTDCMGGMDRDIVLWRTGAYRTDGTGSYLLGDVMATDLSTGTQRRLTTEARYLGVGTKMSLPRAIFFVPAHAGSYYVVNLQALGIIDEDGHLLAGPALDEITELGLQ